ncbi:MAG: hypothetical protein AAB449_00015 [Patescibacteria group bacterium]
MFNSQTLAYEVLAGMLADAIVGVWVNTHPHDQLMLDVVQEICTELEFGQGELEDGACDVWEQIKERHSVTDDPKGPHGLLLPLCDIDPQPLLVKAEKSLDQEWMVTIQNIIARS